MTRFLLLLVGWYRLCISPLLPPSCRFEPTCSAYAQEALVQWGWWRGLGLICMRVGKCHPWHPGGYDPVPDASSAKGNSYGRQ